MKKEISWKIALIILIPIICILLYFFISSLRFYFREPNYNKVTEVVLDA